MDDRAARELDRLITRRHDGDAIGEALLEPTYAESVRRYNERAQAEMRRRWLEFHTCMCGLHTRLAEEHREKAEALSEEGRVHGA